MIRVGKLEGFGNIQLERAPIPDLGPRDVLAKAHRSLISRGSELFRRYAHEEAIPPQMMGYSLAGVAEGVGSGVEDFHVGDRVMMSAPHAQYAVGSVDETGGAKVVALPDAMSFEEGTFLPLLISSVGWADSSRVQAGDTVVILGQGLVGLLMLQVLKAVRPGRIITADALAMRCGLSAQFGADHVIDINSKDPVTTVQELTDGEGADVVIDCVGGHGGVKSFAQAQDMVRVNGTLQLIALYQGAPLPLDASKFMNRTLVAGIVTPDRRASLASRAVEMMASGQVQVAPMITHRFAFQSAKEAFDLLWNAPDEALGVILEWA